jgi:caffeoyl-CoA O-methyltransferase
MNKGGIILSDNVLWSGKVVEPLKEGDLSTKILLEYNQTIETMISSRNCFVAYS